VAKRTTFPPKLELVLWKQECLTEEEMVIKNALQLKYPELTFSFEDRIAGTSYEVERKTNPMSPVIAAGMEKVKMVDYKFDTMLEQYADANAKEVRRIVDEWAKRQKKN
jgi:hypothetical protein